MDYKDLFFTLYPNFFERDYVKNLPEKDFFDELILDLKDFSEKDLEIKIPQNITFGFWQTICARLCTPQKPARAF